MNIPRKEVPLVTINLRPMSGMQYSITTDDPDEAARWLLRTMIDTMMFSNLNPLNPLREVHFYPLTGHASEDINRRMDEWRKRLT